MPKRLILNADDFGLTPGINTAIAELYDAGALTSATLMAAGPAFDHAVALALARPTLGIGCHIVLTDGDPVSPPRSIPSLLAPNTRTLRPTLRPRLRNFLAALITRQIDLDEIEREATAQIRKIQQTGLTVTHLDAHKHTHIAPPIMTALLRAALRTGVPAIRNPFEQPWAFPLSNGTPARTSQIRLIQPLQRGFLRRPEIRSGQIRTTDGTLGISATGHLDEPTLRNLLAALPEGTWELVTHPGYNDPDLDRIPTRLRETRNTERKALLAVFNKSANQQTNDQRVGATGWPILSSSIGKGGVKAPQISSPHLPLPELIHYGDLAATSPSRTAHQQLTIKH